MLLSVKVGLEGFDWLPNHEHFSHTLKKYIFSSRMKAISPDFMPKNGPRWPKMAVCGKKLQFFHLTLYSSSSGNGSNHVFSRYDFSDKAATTTLDARVELMFLSRSSCVKKYLSRNYRRGTG